MKKLIVYIFFSFIYFHAAAQDSVTVAQQFSAELAKKFAIARIVDFQYTGMSGRNLSPILLGKNLGKREISNNYGLKTSLNLPLLKGKKWLLSYNFLYNYQHVNMELPDHSDNTAQLNLHYLSSTGSFTYFSRLLDKTILYNGSLILDGSQKKLERIKPMGSAIMVLRKDKKISMTVGLVAFYDRSSQTPVIPVFTYTQNFENNWRLDLILPQRILLQTRLLPNGRFSFGSQLNAVTFYERTGQIVDFANKFEFRQTEIRSGVTYEYLIHKSIILTAKGGVMNVLNSKLTEKGESFSDGHYLMKLKSGASGYFSLGISFNPF